MLCRVCRVQLVAVAPLLQFLFCCLLWHVMRLAIWIQSKRGTYTQLHALTLIRTLTHTHTHSGRQKAMPLNWPLAFYVSCDDSLFIKLAISTFISQFKYPATHTHRHTHVFTGLLLRGSEIVMSEMNTWTLGWPPQLRFMCACSICTVQCPLGPLGPPVLSSPWSGRLRLCRQLTLIYGIGMHSRKPLTSPQNAGSLPIWLRQRLHRNKATKRNAVQFSAAQNLWTAYEYLFL